MEETQQKDPKSTYQQILKECYELEDAPVNNQSVFKLGLLWYRFAQTPKPEGSISRCFDALLWCSTKLIFNANYEYVEASLKYDLKAAIESCKEALEKYCDRRKTTARLTEICVDPWTTQLVEDIMSKNETDNEIMNTTPRIGFFVAKIEYAAQLWKMEGPVLIFRRIESLFMTSGRPSQSLYCLLQSLILNFSKEFSEGRLELGGTKCTRYPFGLDCDILGSYGMMCFLGKIPHKDLLSVDWRLSIAVLTSLRRIIDCEDCNPMLLLTFTKQAVRDALLYLARVYTWELLASENNNYEILANMFFTWIGEFNAVPRFSVTCLQKTPFQDIAENLHAVSNVEKLYHIARKSLSRIELDKKWEVFFQLYMLGIDKETRTFESVQKSPGFKHEDILRFKQHLANTFIELSEFSSDWPYLRTQFILAAFTLCPSHELYLVMFSDEPHWNRKKNKYIHENLQLPSLDPDALFQNDPQTADVVFGEISVSWNIVRGLITKARLHQHHELIGSLCIDTLKRICLHLLSRKTQAAIKTMQGK